MSYPNSSDWNSAQVNSGFYLHTVSGRTSACSTTGWNLLLSLQSELIGRLDEYGPLQTYDGATVDSSSVPQNDPQNPGAAVGWDRNTLRAMYAVAQRLRVPSTYLSSIRADAESLGGSVSAPTLQVGIWMADRIYHGFVQGGDQELWGVGSPSEVTIPVATNFPRVDAAPPVPPGETAGSVCNALTPEAASLIPAMRTVVPFSFNPLIAFGLLALVVGAGVLISRDVPGISSRAKAIRARRNPDSELRRFWYFGILNSVGGLRERFGPFETRNEAQRVRGRMLKLGGFGPIGPIHSSKDRYPANVPMWMRR